jgi:outer membrane protein OmpA-like peptidoglycan-associated protein
METERARVETERARNETEQAKSDTAQVTASLATVDSARRATQVENTDLKAKLLTQLNAVMETRATTRGLIVNMSGVTFQSGKAVLLPAAREKLAKIAGLIMAHPGLKLESEGYTDNVGSDELNLRLSEQRAAAAQDYLVSQGVPATAIVHRGLGKASPIDSNDSASGRQKNRRVELVVSGAGLTPAS